MARQTHILVVDDDGDVRGVIVAILEERGYRVSSAADGALMRDFLNADDPLDAVVLDSLMPGEASSSLALHLKAWRLPMVMISGSPEAMKFAEEHGLQLLKKPFRSGELIEALDIALADSQFGQRDV